MNDIEQRVRDSFGRQTFMRLIGASVEAVGAGRLEIALPWREDLAQQNGFVHAAVVTALLDTASGYAALTMMPPGSEVLSVEFKVNLLAPAVGRRFVARASVKKAGRTLTITAADCVAVRDDGSETLVATMLGTMMRREASS